MAYGPREPAASDCRAESGGVGEASFYSCTHVPHAPSPHPCLVSASILFVCYWGPLVPACPPHPRQLRSLICEVGAVGPASLGACVSRGSWSLPLRTPQLSPSLIASPAADERSPRSLRLPRAPRVTWRGMGPAKQQVATRQGCLGFTPGRPLEAEDNLPVSPSPSVPSGRTFCQNGNVLSCAVWYGSH